MIYLNGQWLPLDEAKISVLDRGFIFGDGVYEMIPVYRRKAFRAEGHLKRLQRSLDALGIANPHSLGDWRALVETIIAKQAFEQQGVYIQVTRGVAPRDHRFPKAVQPTVFMMATPLTTPGQAVAAQGVRCVTTGDFRWYRCDVKTISLAGNVLMRQFSAEREALETIMFRNGFLSEGSASNVLIVRHGVILSPCKDNHILHGITLEVVLELAQAAKLPVELRPIAEAEVRSADEIWICSSTKEVLPVTQLDGQPVGQGTTAGKPGPVYAQIRQAFNALTARI